MLDQVKKLGFGFMRLPQKDDQMDYEQVCRMVDVFLERGFSYFDTAHGYHNGLSEEAVRRCLTSRYPREKYLLANKLSVDFFHTQEEIRPLFEAQLKACGVDYFDFYLMHCQNKANFAHYKRCRAYETALELQAEGKFRHFGISFHDKAEVLEQILTEYPQVSFVQIQFNYVDYEDVSVESRKCYEVCCRHHKPVIVMEPVKGGQLVRLPEQAQAVFDGLGGGSNASYAIRFAAGFEGVKMVLSGMSDLAMLEENTAFMADFKQLDEQEQAAVHRVCEIFRGQGLIACTACRYCTPHCPKSIAIPDLFACLNTRKMFPNDNIAGYYYHNIHTAPGRLASDCIGCGRCEASCPQHLEIRQLLRQVSAAFDKASAK